MADISEDMQIVHVIMGNGEWRTLHYFASMDDRNETLAALRAAHPLGAAFLGLKAEAMSVPLDNTTLRAAVASLDADARAAMMAPLVQRLAEISAFLGSEPHLVFAHRGHHMNPRMVFGSKEIADAAAATILELVPSATCEVQPASSGDMPSAILMEGEYGCDMLRATIKWLTATF